MANILISDINVAGTSLLTDLTEAELQVTGGCGHHNGYYGRGTGSGKKRGGRGSGKKGRGSGKKGKSGKKRGGHGHGCYC